MHAPSLGNRDRDCGDVLRHGIHESHGCGLQAGQVCAERWPGRSVNRDSGVVAGAEKPGEGGDVQGHQGDHSAWGNTLYMVVFLWCQGPIPWKISKLNSETYSGGKYRSKLRLVGGGDSALPQLHTRWQVWPNAPAFDAGTVRTLRRRTCAEAENWAAGTAKLGLCRYVLLAPSTHRYC